MRHDWTSHELFTLYRGDALELMPEMAGPVDAVIADPPYSSGGATRGDRTARTSAKYQRSDAVKHEDFQGDNRDQRSWAYWCTLWLSAARAAARPGVPCLVFTDWRQLPALTDAMQAAGWVWRGVAVWDKTLEARPQKGRFRAQAEFIAWGTNGPAPSDGPCLPGVFRHVAPRSRCHMSQKPLGLMRDLVQICPAGGTVLDPFAGTGTTGEAALLEGRRFVGIELCAHYHRKALERLEAAALAAPAAA